MIKMTPSPDHCLNALQKYHKQCLAASIAVRPICFPPHLKSGISPDAMAAYDAEIQAAINRLAQDLTPTLLDETLRMMARIADGLIRLASTLEADIEDGIDHLRRATDGTLYDVTDP